MLTRDLRRLADAPFDVVVVGGGVYGVCIAYDAALRGLSVALLDRGDIGGATSANNFKILHGGLRYLQAGDLGRMRQSILDRRAMARIAPHLSAPLAFLMPTSRRLTRSRLALAAGFLVDRAIGFDRNKGLPPSLALPPGRTASRRECVAWFPELAGRAWTGGAVWYDYQMQNSDRLTLALAAAAVKHGAVLGTYVEASSPLLSGATAGGVRARDVMTGAELDVRGAVTVNCAGPWAARLAGAFGATRQPLLLTAMNVVTTRPAESMALGGFTPGGRLLFRAPWRGRTIVGTWQSSAPSTPSDDGSRPTELAAFVSEINEAFPGWGLRAEEVSLVHSGLAPAVWKGRALDLQPHSEVVDHARDGVEGAMTVVGVKYTTARSAAAQAVDLIVEKMGGGRAPSRTAEIPLPGALADVDGETVKAVSALGGQRDVASRLVLHYGSAWTDVAALGRDGPSWLSPVTEGAAVTPAEIVYAVRSEAACTLADVVMRRTGLGAVGYPGDAAVRACAAILRQELGWSDARESEEIASLRRLFP